MLGHGTAIGFDSESVVFKSPTKLKNSQTEQDSGHSKIAWNLDSSIKLQNLRSALPSFRLSNLTHTMKISFPGGHMLKESLGTTQCT